MKYSIMLTVLAREMLGEISDPRIRNKISERIDRLTDSPDLQGKPLKGAFSSYRSVRVVGQRYRIVYKVEKEKVIVYVVGVGVRKEGNRDDIYHRLKKLLETIRSEVGDADQDNGRKS